jgi:hypothetical protein
MTKLVFIAAALAIACACESPHDHCDQTGPGHTAPAPSANTQAGLIDEAVAQAREQADRFDRRRNLHLERVHAKLAFDEVQQTMLSGLADILPLTDTGRTDVDTKLDTLASKLDQASLAVDQLDESSDRDYAAADQTVRQALEGVETARAQAWRAIGDARRPEPAETGSNPQPLPST